jgi:hypothetical protein
MTDYPIEKSSEIFFEIAQKYGEDPITDHDQIMSLLADLDQQLGGLVILDFLDMSNWDNIESFELDRETDILKLVWHDYRGKNESEEEREIRSMVFPASLYSCALQVNSIVPIVGPKIAIFLINGFAKTEKEIKKLFKEQADEIKVVDNSFFEKRVLRRVGKEIEVMDFHCTPMYSLAIIPKQSGIGSHHSKDILYYHNFRVAIDRIKPVVEALDRLTEGDADEISEKVNTVRRIMEFALKVECCSRSLTLKKTYSQVLLGDLIAAVKHEKEEHIRDLLGRFAGRANEFSHDSGKPIEIANAKIVTSLALSYLTLLEIEHKPRFR